jgi:hypothetical protein
MIPLPSPEDLAPEDLAIADRVPRFGESDLAPRLLLREA